ncbi:MFS general substrate transporter [Polychaeton citri CBS 116435]|uniref:MFS general substrate transporter n=1 Tax=Polychaeton citri CBS 116435 TaxID=1314669 RepID=A0A9P4Q068_9PEZI|nr:MFS general substrate transporter [Polychaeton citri CBS 116435]
MFGFHSRHRSLIPVKGLDLLDEKLKMRLEEEQMEVEMEYAPRSPRDNRNLTMVFLLFLAEGIMASSLSAQVGTLLPEAGGCLGVSSSFVQSLLDCAYFFGGTAGLGWGWVCDRMGRRKVALGGLLAMAVCCACMGLATGLAACAALRFVAGAVSSAVSVAALSMLADLTHGRNDRTKLVARLPLVTVCGSIGPLASRALQRVAQAGESEGLNRLPSMVPQIACAGLVLAIAVAEVCLLEETLPSYQPVVHTIDDHDCEKTAFLGETGDSLNISIIEALNDDAARPLPSQIGLLQMASAPSILILVTSFSLLSLQSSIFDVLLPHLGHTASHEAGLGISCAWLGPLLLAIKALAALRILHLVPSVVSCAGVLPMFRRISVVFPALYLIVLLMTFGSQIAGLDATASTAVFNTIAIFIKTTLSGAAQVLVLLLVLSSAPEASATGTLIGITSISGLFRAFAVCASGLSYYVSDEYSVMAVNAVSWAVLVAVALTGTLVTLKLREAPRVGADIPADCLAWEGMFDAESDDDEA